MLALSIVSLIIVIGIDYLTGRELVISAAYLVPASLCAWHGSARAVVLMAVANGLAAGIMGHVEGHPYSHLLFHYWSSLTCLLTSLALGLALHRLRRTLADSHTANTGLQQTLADLEASTAEIRRLQNGLQVICAWTHQIKVGDQWMSPDEFLTTQLRLTLSHGMSPEAHARLRQQVDAREQQQQRGEVVPPPSPDQPARTDQPPAP